MTLLTLYSPNPVTRGALLRHKVTIRGLPSEIYWGTAISEEWNSKLHPDATTWAYEIDHAGRKRRIGKPNLEFVKFDPVHPDIESVVEDRWCPLICKVSLLTNFSWAEDRIDSADLATSMNSCMPPWEPTLFSALQFACLDSLIFLCNGDTSR